MPMPIPIPIPNFCIYTVLIGDYESLNEQPAALSSNVPFICLTDDPSLVSDTWTVVEVPTAFPMDPIRSQRILKICPHLIPALSGFDHSLYMDNSVVLRESPEKFIGKLPMTSGLGLPHHSSRHSVHDEFIEVARLGFDDQSRIFEQLHHYLASGAGGLDDKPYWSALLLRDHRDVLVRRTMELWAFHVLRYSRRDQLSFNAATRATGLVPNCWEIDNLASFFHKWPLTPGRQRFAGTRNPMTSIMPLPTQLAQSESELATIRLELDVVRRESNGFFEGISARSYLLSEARERLNAAEQALQQCRNDLQEKTQSLERLLTTSTESLAATSERAAAYEQALEQTRKEACATLAAVHASTSWRVTAPLRYMKRLLT